MIAPSELAFFVQIVKEGTLSGAARELGVTPAAVSKRLARLEEAELATASDAHAQLHDQSFAEFCNRPGLPDFDFIGLHGIWSWISEANRAVIVDFVRRKLNQPVDGKEWCMPPQLVNAVNMP
eukprot:gene35337-39975_t